MHLALLAAALLFVTDLLNCILYRNCRNLGRLLPPLDLLQSYNIIPFHSTIPPPSTDAGAMDQHLL
jgi:hypothetical protein